MILYFFFFFFSSRRRHTRLYRDWSSDVCSSDLGEVLSHALRPVGAEHLKGLGVLVVEDGVRVLVALGEFVPVRFGSAVAGARRAGGGAGEPHAGVAWRSGGRPRDRRGTAQRPDNAPAADGDRESDTPDPQT